jgi:hypothetical protein
MLNVPDRSRRRRQLHRVLAHRPGEADDLGRALALHDQRRQQRGQRCRRRATLHHLAHGAGRLGFAEVLVAHDLLEQWRKHLLDRPRR